MSSLKARHCIILMLHYQQQIQQSGFYHFIMLSGNFKQNFLIFFSNFHPGYRTKFQMCFQLWLILRFSSAYPKFFPFTWHNSCTTVLDTKWSRSDRHIDALHTIYITSIMLHTSSGNASQWVREWGKGWIVEMLRI